MESKVWITLLLPLLAFSKGTSEPKFSKEQLASISVLGSIYKEFCTNNGTVQTQGCTDFRNAILGDGLSKVEKCWTVTNDSNADISQLNITSENIYISVRDDPSSTACPSTNRQALHIIGAGINCGFPASGGNRVTLFSVDNNMPSWASGFIVGFRAPVTKWSATPIVDATVSDANIKYFLHFLDWELACTDSGEATAGTWGGAVYVCGNVNPGCEYQLNIATSEP